MDLIIRNAMVFGKREQEGSGIEGGRIVKVGKIGEKADEEINADGKLTSPAFIDPHIHRPE